MPFRIIRNDITKVRADAVVNTANPDPKVGTGTDSAVYEAAGKDLMLAERKKIGPMKPGEAAVTPAFRLPAKYVIHTVGPEWIDGEHGEFEILRSCYRKPLLLADHLGCESIAFPLIATGNYGFPKDKALNIALAVIREHLEHSDLNVTLVVFDRHTYQTASGLTEQIEEFIDENYVGAKTEAEYGGQEGSPSGHLRRRRRLQGFLHLSTASADVMAAPDEMAAPGAAAFPLPYPAGGKQKKADLEDIVNNLGESFQKRLLRMIDERGMSDPEVYKRANVDRKLFSKIRCSEDYIPKKKTIMALAIALRLNLDDTRDLLASAGLALTNNSKTDVIVRFCIENGIYDIYEVNALLFRFLQPVLS
jgi:O-acetyl-ADP-ribose deacetylase (regulator of RNase III)